MLPVLREGQTVTATDSVVGSIARLGYPDDLDSTPLFLVSPSSRFVTGTVVPFGPHDCSSLIERAMDRAAGGRRVRRAPSR